MPTIASLTEARTKSSPRSDSCILMYTEHHSPLSCGLRACKPHKPLARPPFTDWLCATRRGVDSSSMPHCTAGPRACRRASGCRGTFHKQRSCWTALFSTSAGCRRSSPAASTANVQLPKTNQDDATRYLLVRVTISTRPISHASRTSSNRR